MPCNCKRSSCLKRYCECFKLGDACSSDCFCTSCKNKEGTDTRKRAVHDAKTKNGEALTAGYELRHGCTCKRNRCIKKYCVCFKNGVHCGPKCRCGGCKNTDPEVDYNPRKRIRIEDKDKPKLILDMLEFFPNDDTLEFPPNFDTFEDDVLTFTNLTGEELKIEPPEVEFIMRI